MVHRRHRPRRRIGVPKGLLRYISLKLLANHPMSGIEITEKIEEFTNWRPSPGSVYPLLASLEEKGFIDNTLVAYTSDHGEMLGKFGMWWKCSLLDDSARVPLVVAGPGFKQGSRVKTPVELHDLRASLFHATGCTRPAGWRGNPLQEITKDNPGHVAFSEYHGHGTRGSAFMIRRGRWKYIYNNGAPNQLFDMDADPEDMLSDFQK